MVKYNHSIERWWAHLGIWDRQQASGYLVENYDGEWDLYLEATDEWWESLSNERKAEVYEEFFSEN